MSRARAGLLLALALLVVGLAAPARAAGFDLDFFKPTTAATGFFNEDNGLTLGRGRLDTEFAGSYSHRPLVLRNPKAANPAGGDVVRDRVTAYASVMYGLTTRIDLGVRFAMVARQVGVVEVDVTDGSVPQRVSLTGVGDTDVIARITLLAVNRRDSAFALTLTAPVALPTGARDALAGSGKVGFRPHLTAGWQRDAVSVAGTVGFVFRRTVEVTSSSLVVGNAAVAGLGLSWTAIPERLWLLAEISGMADVNLSSTGAGTGLAQVLAGPRVLLPGSIFLQAGAGTGLSNTAGSPRFAASTTLGRVW